ncbi:uncharacterized protein PV09_09341 [Verruconis gallopava]|uniref:Uncharacterized protein n=1 Tax=Verruconis gallopava TaxID=253628 RepID=A0A0D1X9N1_9PEZI|nr:uncharacterized protein PV09_09341 [Verruconis gallopava]KIV98895.1 hypothetical protein PV09_09341 [Verruconis gallopava]
MHARSRSRPRPLLLRPFNLRLSRRARARARISHTRMPSRTLSCAKLELGRKHIMTLGSLTGSDRLGRAGRVEDAASFEQRTEGVVGMFGKATVFVCYAGQTLVRTKRTELMPNQHQFVRGTESGKAGLRTRCTSTL